MNLNLENEIWKDIIGYEGLYKVSNLGIIKSYPRNGTINTEKILKGLVVRGGYLRVCLQKNGKRKYIAISRIVAKAFPEICGEWFDDCVIDHINTIRTDNRAENLRVCTPKENNNNPLTILHKSIANLGEKNPNFGKKLSEETKQKISQKLSGENHPMFGKNHKQDSIQKMKNSHIGLGAKLVYQYNKNFELINIWKCAKECEKFGFTSSNICECCNGKRKTHKGYIWSYENKS